MTPEPSERERTAQAWERTALGTTVFGVALLRVGVVGESIADVMAGMVALLGGATLAWRARRGRRQPEWVPSAALLRGVTAATVTIGGLALVGALVR